MAAVGDVAVGRSGTGSAALSAKDGEAAVRQSDRCESSHGSRNDHLGASVETTFAEHDSLEVWDFYGADAYAEVSHKVLPEILDGQTFYSKNRCQISGADKMSSGIGADFVSPEVQVRLAGLRNPLHSVFDKRTTSSGGGKGSIPESPQPHPGKHDGK